MLSLIRRGAAAVVMAAVAGGPALAAENELRTFSVTVDGRPAGTFKMAYRAEDGGTETIAAVADVKVKVAILSYTYSLKSHEVWKDGRVASVEAFANDDGKKKSVKAVASAGGLLITANGKTTQGRADVLTTTGWRFPGAADRPRDVTVLDTEEGTETAARLEALPAAQLTVGGAAITAQRFRLTGKDIDTVWWYDQGGRPVRQEMVWDGHKVVLELVNTLR